MKNNTDYSLQTSSSAINPIKLRHSLAVIAFVLTLACFALSPTARAQDGAVGDGTSTAEGFEALQSLAAGGESDTAVGGGALRFNTTGSNNTAIGDGALVENQTSNDNTATGYVALQLNTGTQNTATGSQALLNNHVASDNTAVGFRALVNNDTDGSGIGSFNTAVGESALASNTDGDRNTAVGDGAMIAGTTGSQNTAVGVSALRNNTTGFGNIAIGQDACNANQSANSNTGVGWSALLSNTAPNNAAVGYAALVNNTTGHDNMAEGFEALANNKSGSSNIALGSNAGINLTTGSNNIDIGAPGVAAEANTIRIGKSGTQKKTFVAGIRGATVASGVGVIIGTTGQLGTVLSSARFKEEIKPMDKASEAILQLKPVTFRYKQELDPDAIPQFGLIAEQVEKVNPDLVVRDEDGKVNTVRYEAVNAMLLNEFLKEHRTVAELKDLTQKQQAMIAQQQKQIEALTATVQKVSEKIDLDKTAPQLVVDRR